LIGQCLIRWINDIQIVREEVKSVANVARIDINGFPLLSAQACIKPEIRVVPIETNRALPEIKAGKIRGSGILKIST
jgi:hypothetical protein